MSNISIFKDLLAVPCGVTNNGFFNGGEITSCLFKFFSLINSLNSSFTSFLLKFILLYGGFEVTKRGASSSFGPPSGLPVLAQLEIKAIDSNKKSVL